MQRYKKSVHSKRTDIEIFVYSIKKLAAIPKNVRWEPASSVLSRTNRGSRRLYLLGHTPQPLWRFSAAKVMIMCSARANRFYFFIPKYSSMISDPKPFRKYSFSSGESSSNPSSSAQISCSTQFSITSSFCCISFA